MCQTEVFLEEVACRTLVTLTGKMASKNDNGLEDVCQCSVCLERYSDPRMLPCRHCFCKECLEDLLNVRPQGGKISLNHDIQIVCPNCREICKFENEKILSSLPKNLHLSQVIDLPSERSPQNDEGINYDEICILSDEMLEVCSFCKATPTITRPRSETGFVKCSTCCKLYCGACLKQKHNVNNERVGSAVSKHKLMIWKFTKEGDLSLCCEDHKYVLKYYCNNCKKVSCIDCCLAFHRQHEIHTLDFTAYVIRENLKADVEEAKKRIEGIEKLKNNYGRLLTTVKNSKQDAIEFKMEQKKIEILQQVTNVLNKAQDDLIYTWNKHRVTLITGLSKEIEELEIAEASGRSLLGLVNNEIKKCDITLITELKPYLVREDLQKILVPSAKMFPTECLSYSASGTVLTEESCDGLKFALGSTQGIGSTGNFLPSHVDLSS